MGIDSVKLTPVLLLHAGNQSWTEELERPLNDLHNENRYPFEHTGVNNKI